MKTREEFEKKLYTKLKLRLGFNTLILAMIYILVYNSSPIMSTIHVGLDTIISGTCIIILLAIVIFFSVLVLSDIGKLMGIIKINKDDI